MLQPSPTEKKVLFVVNEANFFLSHRLPIALAIQKAGYQIHVAAPANITAQQKIKSHFFTFHALPLTRQGMNPLTELWSIFSLYRLYCRIQPQLVHLVTIKPVLYGSLAARIAKIPAIVAAITGLGYIFILNNSKAKLLRNLIRVFYWVGLKHNNIRVIFQNPEDRSMLLDMGVINENQAILIRGSGVDMQQFYPVPEQDTIPMVVLASRMLWDKGIGEFVTAATILHEAGTKARFVLVGDTDSGNPTAIPIEQLKAWKQEGFVEWWGRRTDMLSVFSQSHIVCLPSYREGVPKVLIEAAACGKPIVTTDAPGCREIVRNNINGLLVPLKDANALANALRNLIESPQLRQYMGQRGREIAETEFSLEYVVDETLKVYHALQNE